MHRLRILTLNCWNVSEPFDERMALVCAGIRALDPDLVGLQEIVVRGDGFDQGAAILDGLGYHRAFGPAFEWGEGDAFGNLVTSRWPIVRSAVHVLPGSEGDERRSVCAALVDAPGGPVAFAATHFNWKPKDGPVRERQALAAAAFVEEWAHAARRPAVLVGDLNAEPDSPEILYLAGLAPLAGRRARFRDAWRVAGGGEPGHTWDNRNRFAAYGAEPDRRIDYVLVGDAGDPAAARIEGARLALDEPRGNVFPSDHFAVVADVWL